MKKPTLILWFLIFGLFLVQSTALYAQDSLKVASEVHKKVLVDNDKIKMMELEFAPGDVEPWHHHPNYITYILSDGQLEITVKGKQPEVVDIKAGGYMYSPAETHRVKNTGTTAVKMLIMELKPAGAQKTSAPGKPAIKK
jgi:beta-alanine degradation protein BauB